MINKAGSYYCRVKHGNTLVRSCPAHVSLAEFKPPNIKGSEITVHRTNDIILSSCQHVHSIPPANVTWFYNNNKSLPTGVFTLPSGNLLISALVYKEHIGTYHCIANNSFVNKTWESPATKLLRAHHGKCSCLPGYIAHVLSNQVCRYVHMRYYWLLSF